MVYFISKLQSNLNSSNTDCSFCSRYEILPIAQENKYLAKFSYFIMELYVVCAHFNRLVEAILLSTLNIQLLCRKLREKIPELSLFAS